jgi:hypothetical protein
MYGEQQRSTESTLLGLAWPVCPEGEWSVRLLACLPACLPGRSLPAREKVGLCGALACPGREWPVPGWLVLPALEEGGLCAWLAGLACPGEEWSVRLPALEEDSGVRGDA